MSEKDRIQRAIAGLPDSTNWREMTDALVSVVARHGTPADVARLHFALLSPDDLAEYANLPAADSVPLADVLAELEARRAAG